MPSSHLASHTVLSHATPQASLQAMAHALAEMRDPWARHWLVIPGKGRAQYCLQEWAAVHGIASHGQSLQVRALVELAAAGDDPRHFNSDALVLAVAECLQHAKELHIDIPLPQHISFERIEGRHIAWAKHIADAIDMGYLCREADTRFTDGTPAATESFLKDLCQQESIQKILANHIGFQTEADFLTAASVWIADWEGKGGFPHLWIQLDVGLPQILMKRLLRLLELVETLHPGRSHLYLLEPSPSYWGDLPTNKRAWGDDENAGPLLTAFGRRLQDLHNMSIDYELVIHADDSANDACDFNTMHNTNTYTTPTLLKQLQYSSYSATDPIASAHAYDDHSFSIHSCRSPLRELEVCRDRILQALDETDIRPEEILLLLADPGEYAPFVTAALQADKQHSRAIPVHLLGLKGTVPSLLAEGMKLITSSFRERFSQEHLLAIIEHPLIAEKFQLTEHSDSILSWVQDASFRWGLDHAERTHASNQTDHADMWSLTFALQRLALGAIVAPHGQDDIIAGTVPLDRAHGLQIHGLAQLALLLESLCSMRQHSLTLTEKTDGTLNDWCEHLQTLIDCFFADGDSNTTQQKSQILHSIIPQLQKNPSTLKLSASAFNRILDEQLDSLTEGFSAGAGGVNVAPLASHAGCPARMILVCGLGAGRFPRADERPDWHPLAGSRKYGDPSMRDDDRHNLLLAILACEQRFVCTYEGGSDANDKILPPSTPLADLLAAVDACIIKDDDSAHGIFFTHGLNGFSPESHRENVPPLGKSYLYHDYSLATVLSKESPPSNNGPWSQCHTLDHASHTSVGNTTDSTKPTNPTDTISQRDLKYLAEKPCQLFCKNMGIYFSNHENTPEFGDLLEIDKLEQWKLRNRLMHQRVHAHCKREGKEENGNVDGDVEKDENAMYQALCHAGALPPGRIGEVLWKEAIQRRCPLPPEIPLRTLDSMTHIHLGEQRIHMNDEALWAIDDAQQLHCFTASSFQPTLTTGRGAKKVSTQQHSCAMLRACTGAMLIHVGDPSIDITQVHVHYNNKDAAETYSIAINSDIDICEQLTRLFQLRHIAATIPLAMDKYICDAILQIRPSADDDLQDLRDNAVRAAADAWATQSNQYAPPPPSNNPLHRICFRGLDNPCAWTGPSDAHNVKALDQLLPDPGEALVWRYGSALRQWMDTVIIDGDGDGTDNNSSSKSSSKSQKGAQA